MFLSLSLLAAAAQFSPVDDCIYDGIPMTERQAIGEAVLAKRTGDLADLTMQATNRCARENGWSVQQTLQRNGYAAMRIAADVLAARLGKPDWSTIALRAIRERPFDQVKNLAGTGTGGAEFELVLAHMIAADPALPDAVKQLDTPQLESFVLMIKLIAVAEVSRLEE